MDMDRYTPFQICKIFCDEFREISSRFNLFEMRFEETAQSTEDGIAMPGVYIWWHPVHGTLKVGRHLVNSRKRALEHVSADTAGEMNRLAKEDGVRLLLFNVKTDRDIHWVASLEIFLEKHLEPLIASKRTG